MSRKANQVDVNVHIIRDATQPNGVRFSMSSGLGNGDELTFDNKGRPGFDIKFKVVDDTGDGYLFMDFDPPNDKDPMWVKKIQDRGESCPVKGDHWPIFSTTELQDSNTVLLVHNKNNSKQLFKFALMFSKTPHQAPYEIMYDPIGSNQNGPEMIGPEAGGFNWTYAGIALLGLAAIGFVLYQLGVFGHR
jgi:hypothetical protein